MINIILEVSIIALLVITIILIIINLTKSKKINHTDDFNHVEKTVKDEISNLRAELDNKLTNIQKGISDNINSYFQNFNTLTNEKLGLLTVTLKENIKDVNLSVKENTNKIELYLNSIRTTLSESMEKLQVENSKKIDEMRRTVDEKLDTTLNNRLNQSFKLVQDNLSKVEQGLGEMKDLANGVGDLKKVLSNVKTRGIWGEMQLSQILSQILTKDQYAENIVTRPKSKDPVEFVIKLPGDGKQIVYLPIDSKFPLDTYTNLINAYETNDKIVIDKAISDLKQRMKSFARDIRDKYLEVPYTTDFGIMFLPIEGLYAEAAKIGLIEELQNSYRIIIAGPTTMAALLNSLQVGFRTLAIEQRTSEVWNILAAVKTEFGTFETVLKKAQKKIGEANDEIENLVGIRTRQINRKLKDVTELKVEDTIEILELEENK